MSSLKNPLDNDEPFGVVVNGFIADSKEEMWTAKATMSLLKNNFYETLFLEEAAPIEKVLNISVIGERVLNHLSARDILSLASASKRMRHSVGQPSYDALVWKHKLQEMFGKGAVDEAQRTNVSYYRVYRNRMEEKKRQARHQAELRANAFREAERALNDDRILYDPRRRPFGPFGGPGGPLYPDPIWIGEEHRSRIPPSHRPTMFDQAAGPLGARQNVAGLGEPSIGPNRLIGDGYRRQPDFDANDMESVGIPDDLRYRNRVDPRRGGGFDGGFGGGFGGGFDGGFGGFV
ncbi:hypothetical protein QR680_003417 [Steinernema hermaphroditum]|uniref:F-box domain-containing protein n=1 Tax=Steinernema hermaphroditum TaxID=289476 RepID=A0AA39H8J6_9BILA|nr:hypothetical protein QR680_003417 [Steinernema hermaphroditum]